MAKQAMKRSPAKGLSAQSSPGLGQGPQERPPWCWGQEAGVSLGGC